MADGERGVNMVEEYTKDGTVDLKGRPFLRSRGGRWQACSFILVYGVLERMAHFGIAPNLVLYLTNKLHQGTVSSSNNVTNWFGTMMMTTVLGAYVADAHLGRYWTFVFSSAIYLLGMILLFLSVSLPSLRPPPCYSSTTVDCSRQTKQYQIAFFFFALYTIAVGAGGTKPNISTMGADQFDPLQPKEREQRISFFSRWTFSVFFGNLISCTALVYIQDNYGWSVGYAIPAAALGFSIIVFLIGTPFYRHKPPSSSPFTRIARVLVASVRKWRVSLPDDPNELYELEDVKVKRRADHTDSIRFLDKAAVKICEESESPWLLCTVTEVEETKQILKLLPIFITTIMPSVMMAQALTLFVKQGATLDRSMGPHFEVPPASLSAIIIIATLTSLAVYDRWLIPAMRKHTKNPRGTTLLKKMGIGLGLYAFIMMVAALTERMRLKAVRESGLVHAKTTVPLSVFVLVPQFALMGFAEMLVEVGKMEFFYDQAPEGMKSLGASFFTMSSGVGNFVSSFLLSTVSDITKKGGRRGWIENNLNESHLDYYYSFLSALSAINFILFFMISRCYVYNKEEAASSERC